MRSRKQSASIMKSVAFGVITTVLIAVICTGVVTILVLQESVSETRIELMTTVITFTAVFAGALIAGKMAGGKHGTICAAVIMSFLLMQIITNIIFFDGKFLGFIKSLISVAAGGGLSCILLVKAYGKRRKRR